MLIYNYILLCISIFLYKLQDCDRVLSVFAKNETAAKVVATTIQVPMKDPPSSDLMKELTVLMLESLVVNVLYI